MRKIVAGQDVFDAQTARKAAALGPMPATGFPSDALCQWQRSEAKHGIVEAEIVESIHGYSLRYASGMHDFGLIARAREMGDGTFDAAVAFAKSWQADDAARRFVSTSTR